MVKPWLCLPPSWSHELSHYWLLSREYLNSEKTYQWQPFDWKGLHFENRLGVAGGLDKDGQHVKGWQTLGPGFIEVGTVTPKPQEPNPGKIMARYPKEQAVWNKMGFPSSGIEQVKKNLSRLKTPHTTPLFVNLGKNRTTSLEDAWKDYSEGVRELHPYADAFVINISSPNTQGLRDLLKKANLHDFLKNFAEVKKELQLKTPFLLKLSPDIEEDELFNALEVSEQNGFDGWILTNTTAQRPIPMPFPTEGGVSGAPLQKLAKKALTQTLSWLGSDRRDKLVVSCGGALTPQDVEERLQMGADLVQVYSALIWTGPFFFRQVDQWMNQQKKRSDRPGSPLSLG